MKLKPLALIAIFFCTFTFTNVASAYSLPTIQSFQTQLQSLLVQLLQLIDKKPSVEATTSASVATPTDSTTLRHCDITFSTWMYGKSTTVTKTVYGNPTDIFAIGLQVGSTLPFSEQIQTMNNAGVGYFTPDQYAKQKTYLTSLAGSAKYQIMSAVLANTNSTESGRTFNSQFPYAEARVANGSVSILANVGNCVTPIVKKALPYAGISYVIERNSISAANWQDTWLHTPDCMGACSVALDNRLSVVFLRYKWSQINPAPGVYNFGELIAQLKQVQAAGKTASIGVLTGIYSPTWVFEPGATRTSTYIVPDGGDGYSHSTLPAPWKDKIVGSYNLMYERMAQAIKAQPGLINVVALVKNSVISSHSEETRMEDVDAGDDNTSTTSMAMNIQECIEWKNLGYSEAKVMAAFSSTSATIARVFPGIAIGTAVVTGSYRFPNVQDCTNPKATNSTLEKIVKDFVTTYGDRAVVNGTVLSYDMKTPYLIKWVKDNGGHIGFQLNRSEVGCNDKQFTKTGIAECTSPDYIAHLQQAIESGITAGADFIEVHDGNINRHQTMLPAYDLSLRLNSRSKISCTQDGVLLQNGTSHQFFDVGVAPANSTCAAHARVRLCTDGSLSKESTYTFATCTDAK